MCDARLLALLPIAIGVALYKLGEPEPAVENKRTPAESVAMYHAQMDCVSKHCGTLQSACYSAETELRFLKNSSLCPQLAACVGSCAEGEETKDVVKADYATVAGGVEVGGSTEANEISAHAGYSEEEIAIMGASNRGLQCGNPARLVQLRAGERLLDIGSGSGADMILAAAKLSKLGKGGAAHRKT